MPPGAATSRGSCKDIESEASFEVGDGTKLLCCLAVWLPTWWEASLHCTDQHCLQHRRLALVPDTLTKPAAPAAAAAAARTGVLLCLLAGQRSHVTTFPVCLCNAPDMPHADHAWAH
jgi:hypothetical protein